MRAKLSWHLFNLTHLRWLELKLTYRAEWSRELLQTLHSDLWWTVVQEHHIKPNKSYKVLLSLWLWAGDSEHIKGILAPFKRLCGLEVKVTANCFACVLKIFAVSSWIRHGTYASHPLILLMQHASLWFMAGQLPYKGVGFNQVQGGTSGKPISFQLSLIATAGIDMLVQTEGHCLSHRTDMWTEAAHILSRSILIVLLKVPGELTRALNEPLPCALNVSQM